MGESASCTANAGHQARQLPVSLELPDTQPITVRLAGAGSLRGELEALLAAAPPGATPEEYRELLLRQNVAGKGSAIASMWAWKRLKLRYALDPAIVEHRAFLAARRAGSNSSISQASSFRLVADARLSRRSHLSTGLLAGNVLRGNMARGKALPRGRPHGDLIPTPGSSPAAPSPGPGPRPRSR